MPTWSTLLPDPAMVQALDQADDPTSRDAIRNELVRLQRSGATNLSALREMRKRWSEQFARACATMVANGLRALPEIGSGFHITPDASGGNQESFTPLGYKKGKRIDVVVSRELVGLQIGVSLKGLNFRDGDGGNFDKNLTGRLYELRDEVSTVHDYLPRAFMAGLFFVPAAACFDKVSGPSSFAHTVAQLRSRSGRLDPLTSSTELEVRLRRCRTLWIWRTRRGTKRITKGHSQVLPLRRCWGPPGSSSATRPAGSIQHIDARRIAAATRFLCPPRNSRWNVVCRSR
jgi:hypothetical protein